MKTLYSLTYLKNDRLNKMSKKTKKSSGQVLFT